MEREAREQESREQEPRKIFLVDDNVTSLAAGRNLLKPFYSVYPAPSGEMLFKMLEKVKPDLILLDIEMPDMNGYDIIRQLKGSKHYADIPVIFLTTHSDEESELRGFDLGAVDYITKPFSQPLLKKRIENQLLILQQRETIQYHADNLTDLVDKKTKEIFSLQNAMLYTVADLVEYRDYFTGGHVMRTQLYMGTLLDKMIENGLYADITLNWNMDFIIPSVLLHDVGKIGISDSILNKPGKLDRQEFEIMKTHVQIGLDAVNRIMKNAPNNAFLKHAFNIVGGHHEKWDGTGYPNGIKGEDIPLEGRLMAIVDVYDALISERPYKQVRTHGEAVEIIAEGRGVHFDPVLVDVFLIVKEQFNEINEKNKTAGHQK